MNKVETINCLNSFLVLFIGTTNELQIEDFIELTISVPIK